MLWDHPWREDGAGVKSWPWRWVGAHVGQHRCEVMTRSSSTGRSVSERNSWTGRKPGERAWSCEQAILDRDGVGGMKPAQVLRPRRLEFRGRYPVLCRISGLHRALAPPGSTAWRNQRTAQASSPGTRETADADRVGWHCAVLSPWPATLGSRTGAFAVPHAGRLGLTGSASVAATWSHVAAACRGFTHELSRGAATGTCAFLIRRMGFDKFAWLPFPPEKWWHAPT